jgi:hypothetical protein
MPQLKSDEWPRDSEPTTTERQVPTSEHDQDDVAEFRAHAPRPKRPPRKHKQEARQEPSR